MPRIHGALVWLAHGEAEVQNGGFVDTRVRDLKEVRVRSHGALRSWAVTSKSRTSMITILLWAILQIPLQDDIDQEPGHFSFSIKCAYHFPHKINVFFLATHIKHQVLRTALRLLPHEWHLRPCVQPITKNNCEVLWNPAEIHCTPMEWINRNSMELQWYPTEIAGNPINPKRSNGNSMKFMCEYRNSMNSTGLTVYSCTSALVY